MRRPTVFALFLTVGALPGGQLPNCPAGAPFSTATTPSLESTWARLWGANVSFDDTWLIRAEPGADGADWLVENCLQQTGHLRVLAEQRVSGDEPGARGADFVQAFVECGFEAFVVGAELETPRGHAGLLALDLRCDDTSFVIPCTTLAEAELHDATAAVARALQRAGGLTPESAITKSELSSPLAGLSTSWAMASPCEELALPADASSMR